jgi:squalene synthase HpnC
VAVCYLPPKEYVRSVPSGAAVYSAAESREYTRWLATHHYENFHVVSFLLPRKLHQDFYNVYSFCRWADDLGDEMGDAHESLRLLNWWRSELEAMYTGQSSHPVFVALQDTVERHGIPIEPFDRLIRAFEQDQTITRYPDFDEVLRYCANSANPVGHLVLYLCGYRDSERRALSDFTCSALQLANFWQDIRVDLEKNRIYLPLNLLNKYGYTVDKLFEGKEDAQFRAVMREAVAVAEDLFRKGLPLIRSLDRRLALDIDLFSRGGMRILQKIKHQNYNVLRRRPRISRVERAVILIQCLPRLLQS